MIETPGFLRLRPFDQNDFKRLISWVTTPEAVGLWSGAFFRYPLDEGQLQRYLDSASQPNARVIFTALGPSNEAVGHIEVSMIWPYLSSRLSRVIVAPDRRRSGVGGAMVAAAAAFSFEAHHVARIDLGVETNNLAAISCYRGQGFEHVGIWPQAIKLNTHAIDVCWMTLTRPNQAQPSPPDVQVIQPPALVARP